MARAKSAILSAADKKAVVADLKAKIAAAKGAHKAVAGEVKTHEKAIAGLGKTAAAHLKELTKHVAALAAITAPAQAAQ